MIACGPVRPCVPIRLREWISTARITLRSEINTSSQMSESVVIFVPIVARQNSPSNGLLTIYACEDQIAHEEGLSGSA
jgi:hypothetical protein